MSQLNKLLKWIQKLFCRHKNVKLVRWHSVHCPDHEPLCAEIEFECKFCGRVGYDYMRGEDYKTWCETVGNYKKV